MANLANVKQTDLMRKIYVESGRDDDAACAAYARAERDGVVVRRSNKRGLTAEQYARALLMNGKRKGWLHA